LLLAYCYGVGSGGDRRCCWVLLLLSTPSLLLHNKGASVRPQAALQPHTNAAANSVALTGAQRDNQPVGGFMRMLWG
jgi:hypothetical protein